jgi:hypothetical protein
LQQAFASQFQSNRAVLNFLNDKLTTAVNNPQGFSPEALAAVRTTATQQTATDYTNASKAVRGQIAARGGSTLPSGVEAQIEGQLAQGAANEESTNQNQITLGNEQQKQANYWNAVRGLGGVATGYDPNAYASGANSGAGTIASLSEANSAAENAGAFNKFMGGLGSGLGAGLSSFATGGLSSFGKAAQPKTPSQ